MTPFEITLKGFDGDTGETDHLVKWINAPDRAALDEWLEEVSLIEYLDPECPIRDLIQSGCVGSGPLDRHDGVDFIVGEENEVSIDEWKQQSREVQG